MKQYRRGFTIIELLIAMTFVAVLMLTVAFLVIRITAIYQKGLTLRSVNQVGRNLIDEFNRAVEDSPVDDELDNRDRYFYTVSEGGRQLQGAFCTNKYSFLWNTGDAINNGHRIRFKNAQGEFVFRLARFRDGGRVICDQLKAQRGRAVLDFSALGGEKNKEVREQVPLELLAMATASADYADTANASESDLALYDFRVFPPTINRVTGHIFYSATFVLGTVRGIDINRTGNYCINTGETLSTDFAYCSINKFNFAMTTMGTGGLDDYYGQRR
jgi:prepilin-type N-terminal cleavage/methylation domain-containing protein